MTDKLPEPLVPAEVDLRGYEFMPLHWERLFKSETWIGAKSDQKVAMLKIWCHAFGQEVPASSLPQNDQLLAEYAGFGMGVSAWRRARTVVLRGFIECSDGRLYHGFLASVAMSSWRARLSDRLRGLKGRIASTEKKLAEPKEAANHAHWKRLLIAQQDELSQITEWAVTAQSWRLSHTPVTDPCHSTSHQTRKRSEVKGSEVKGESKTPSHAPPVTPMPGAPSEPDARATPEDAPATATLRGAMAKALRDEGVTDVAPSHPVLVGWQQAGVSIQLLREAVDIARDKKPKPEPIPVNYLKPIVTQLLSAPEKPPNGTARNIEWWSTAEGIKAKALELGLETDGKDANWLKCAIAVTVGGDSWPWIDPRNGTLERFIDEIRSTRT